MGLPSGESEKKSPAPGLANPASAGRPFLAACACKAMQGDPQKTAAGGFSAKVAIAVECFQQGSLVHDDIEDNDALAVWGEDAA